MAGGIPSEVIGVSVGILLYSSLCLTLSLLLICLLWSYGERWTYVALLSIFTSISTLASIIQQLHYAIAWIDVKQAQFDKAVDSIHKPSLAFGGAAHIVDVVLYWIQFYCYNVMSLMVLFWTIALFRASWGLNTAWLGDWGLRMGLVSKMFGVVFPLLIIGLGNCITILKVPALYFVLQNILMFFNLTAGGVLLALILFKYIKTRRLTVRHAERSPWWASNVSKSGSHTTGSNMTDGSDTPSARQSIYDRALITRFTIGFVLLAAFELAIIVFALFQSSNNAAIAAAGKPDHSTSGATIDIVLFIPGVSASLVTFLVFGTTKSWRQYWKMVRSGCGARSKLQERSMRRRTDFENSVQSVHLDEFERLPSITTQEGTKSSSTRVVDPGLDFGFQRPDTQDSSDGENSLPIQLTDGKIYYPHRAAKTTDDLPV